MKCPLNGLCECVSSCALFVQVSCDCSEQIDENTFTCGLASIATRQQGALVFAPRNFVKIADKQDDDVIEG